MPHDIVITLSDTDYKIAQCWLADVDAWADHAVKDKIRRLSQRTLDNELGNENPAWSIDSLISPAGLGAIRASMNANFSSFMSGKKMKPDDPIALLILANLNLPTRDERDLWSASP